jgi:hypothetical protein
MGSLLPQSLQIRFVSRALRGMTSRPQRDSDER